MSIKEQLSWVQEPIWIVPGLLKLVNGEFPHRKDASSYEVVTPERSVVIDPGSGANRARVVRNLELSGARSRKTVFLATHGHIDHLGGVMQLENWECGNELWVPESHVATVPTGDATASDLYNERFPGVRVDRVLHDGEELVFGDVRIQVISTPGHAPDHACYLIKWRGRILAVLGDIDGGHSERLGGDLDQREKSLARLADTSFTHFVEGHGSITSPLRPREEFLRKMHRFGEKLKPGFGYLADPVWR